MLGSIVLSPLNGLAFICREIANAVEKSLEAEKGQLMGELRALHQRVERGKRVRGEGDRLARPSRRDQRSAPPLRQRGSK
jgi:hypothetical protein